MRHLTVAERHQLRIAQNTLKLSDSMVAVLGGPNKIEARRIIARLTAEPPGGRKPRLCDRYTVHDDAGHAWGAVPLAEVCDLGLFDLISDCSYISPISKMVFLEEDCDLPLFLEVRWPLLTWAERNAHLDEVHDGNDSPIRKMTRLGTLREELSQRV